MCLCLLYPQITYAGYADFFWWVHPAPGLFPELTTMFTANISKMVYFYSKFYHIYQYLLYYLLQSSSTFLSLFFRLL